MAITKMLYITNNSKHVNNAINYILNREKTNSDEHFKNVTEYINNDIKTSLGFYEGSINCTKNKAFEEMNNTKKRYNKMDGRQAYHFIISFRPGETDNDTAWKIVNDFVAEYLGKEYEAVYSLHTDKNHIHGHIIFNSVKFTGNTLSNGYKYHYKNGDWAQYIQPIVDRLCIENGLKPLEYNEDEYIDKMGKSVVTRSYSDKYYNNQTWNETIKKDIDETIENVNSFDEFLIYMKNKDYLFNIGRGQKGDYLTIKKRGMKRNRRLKEKSVGYEYTMEMIKERILLKGLPIHCFELDLIPKITYSKFSYTKYTKYTKYKQMNYLEKAKIRKMLHLRRMLPANVRKNYTTNNSWQVNENLKKLKKTQEEYLMVCKYKISNNEDAFKLLDSLKNKKSELYRNKIIMESDQSINKSLIEIYTKMEALKEYVELYEKYHDLDFKKDYNEYKKLEKQLFEKGQTFKIISDYLESFESNAKTVQINMKEINNQINICKRLLSPELLEEKIKHEKYKRDLKAQNHYKENHFTNSNSLKKNFKEMAIDKKEKVKTFNECVDKWQDKDYSMDEPYYCCERLNPNKYIKLFSELDVDLQGNNYTKTTYELHDMDVIYYNNDREDKIFTDERVPGWNVFAWCNMRDKMNNILNMDNDLIMFYSNAAYLEYKKAYDDINDEDEIIKNKTKEKITKTNR